MIGRMRGCLLVAALAAVAVPHAVAADAPMPPLIPLPAQLAMTEGRFVVDGATPLRMHGASAATGERIAAVIGRGLDLQLAAAPGEARAPGIGFRLDPRAAIPAEGYRLRVSSDGIHVRASDEAGLFYGAVTLWQLLTAAPREGGGYALAALDIDDAPRFAWRGYMLDSARHFHSVDEVKRIIDAMSLHKLNVFHWHLTDDQGWRIEIRRYPALATTGGCRARSGDAAVDAAGNPAPPDCGWYSQAQIRDIVEYAAARQVTVVPEIDLPGHATAAIAAYPELGVTGGRIAVSNQRGIHANLFNVEESTFDFLAGVFAEVVELFPARYVHIGGDEAVKRQWRDSPRVQARMRELGIADEAALQSWFVRRLEAILAGHGRRLVGWDEILEGGLAPNATVMSWRGTEGGIAAARLGHDVVMSPVSALYLDYLQTASPKEPAGRPKLNTLETFYRFEPVPQELDADQRRHILGLQANMWTGDTRTFAGVEHNTFPRLAAVAETGWTPAARKDWDGFLQRLPAQLHRYRLTGTGHARTPFEPMIDSLAPHGDALPAGEARVALSNPLGYTLRYTLDGSEPRAGSALYRAPLQLPLPTTLRAAAFHDGAALAPPVAFRIDRRALLGRGGTQLRMCVDEGPVLRMEDDGPADGPRALFDVAIFEPCWRWTDAPMDGIAGLRVRAGRLPWLIQLSEAEERQRRYLPARSAHGEMDVRIDGCDGPQVATAPLPPAPDADGFVTLSAPVSATAAGTRELCIRFSGDTRPAMWVLDRIDLLPQP